MYNLLAEIVGPENVSREDFELWCYSRDAGSVFPQLPECVVTPKSKKQVAEVLKVADRYKKPVIPRGAGSSMCGAPVPLKRGVVIDLTGLKRIKIQDEEGLFVRAGAGVIWTEIIEVLKQKGREIGLEGPWSAPSATVAGSVAVGAICMGTAKYGGLGTQILGLEVALADGSIVKTGSAANPKNEMVMRDCNGADLTGLFIGSHGTLGIITEVSLKTYPLHQAEAYYAYSFGSLENAVRAVYGLAKDEIAFDCRMFVYPVPEEIGGRAGVVYMLKGSTSRVQELGEKSKKIMQLAHGKNIPEFGEQYYKGRFTARVKAFGEAGPGWLEVAGYIPILRYPDIAKEIIKYWEKREEEAKKLNIKWSLGALLETHSINIPVAIFCNEVKREAWQRINNYWHELAELMYEGGVSPYWIGHISPHIVKRWGSYYQLYKKIKKTLDPNNILNPGML